MKLAMKVKEKSAKKIGAVKLAIKMREGKEDTSATRAQLKALVNKTGETGWVRHRGRDWCIVQRYGMSLYLLRKPEKEEE